MSILEAGEGQGACFDRVRQPGQEALREGGHLDPVCGPLGAVRPDRSAAHVVLLKMGIWQCLRGPGKREKVRGRLEQSAQSRMLVPDAIWDKMRHIVIENVICNADSSAAWSAAC